MAYALGNRKHVFIDWALIEPGYGVAWGHQVDDPEKRPTAWEMPYGVSIQVHPPRIDRRPLVRTDQPWESTINVYSTLFADDGRFRLYYECFHRELTQDVGDTQAMLAYAESTDGIIWEKPAIGAVEFQGSSQNNLVYGRERALGRGAHGATVFKDPSAVPEQRYKLVHMGREAGTPCVFGAVSPDGLQWTALEQPLLPGYMSDTQTVMRFDEEKGKYVGYFRGWSGALHTRRTIAYAESERFQAWPTPRTLVAPDANDNPDADIYTNAYTTWPGARDAHLLFPAFYQRAQDTTELHLLTSRDGVNWQRPLRQPLVPPGEPGSHWEGGLYAGCGLAAFTANEWSLPIGPKWHTHNQGHYAEGRPAHPPSRGYLCRAIWRPDGFTALEARTYGGCTTLPLTFSGDRLDVNVWTRFGGEVAIEIAQENGTPIPGFTFAECDPISGDQPCHTVTWNGRRELSKLAGGPVRLRFRLRRARLHALQFRA